MELKPMPFTFEQFVDGYKNNKVSFVSMNQSDKGDIACMIGSGPFSNYFYFDGPEAESFGGTAKEYIAVRGEDNILRSAYDTLLDFWEDGSRVDSTYPEFADEVLAYAEILKQ